MSKEPALLPISLVFTSDLPLGSGSMQMTLVTDAATGAVHGMAEGKAMEGTQHPLHFTVFGVSGAMDNMEDQKFGGVLGKASVNPFPTEIVYEAPFYASFNIDGNGNGTGKFAVGNNSYQCTVQQL